MKKAAFEVADILENNQAYYSKFNSWKYRSLNAIRRCRTAELGGHIDKCDHPTCGKIHLSYNSCRNRHCPKCQGHKREEWIQARQNELLPVPYFHLVFTIPSELHQLTLENPRLIFGTLFKAAWQTLDGFANNPKFLGAKTGMIGILHTWGQNLSLHPHIHCIVPSGGIDVFGNWKSTKKKGKYLYPVKAMSQVFRAKFVDLLRKNGQKDRALFDKLFSKNWVVYAKQSFKNNRSVIEYLGRYTHKVAISNHRIKQIDNQKNTVTFSVKNYRKDGKKELLTLSQQEFVRRFGLHILPKRFVRIRHFGLLSSIWKKKHLNRLQNELGKPTFEEVVNLHKLCPTCKNRLFFIFFFSL